MPAARGMLVLASTLQVGGGERVLAGLLREAGRVGIPLSIVCLKSAGPVGEELSRAGISLHALGMRSTRSPRALLALLALIRRQEPGLLYIQDHHDCLFWGRLAAGLSGFLPALSPVHSSSEGALKAFRLYNRLLLGLSPHLVTLGTWQEAALRVNERLAEGFWVEVPNPVQPLSPDSGPGIRRGLRDRKILGCVAALRPEKRHDRLLEMFAALPRPDARELWIIGDGELREDLERQSAELGVEGRVRFWGERDDVPELLGQLDLFVLGSEEEALPLSVLEALQARVPVAATPKGAIPDLLAWGKRGLLLRGDDPRIWSRQIDAFLEELPPESERSIWAREIEENYSLEGFSRRYLSLLRYLGVQA